MCNPVGGVACTVASASAQLNFGSNPIISAVTSSSSLLEGSTPTVAPYDMISIFGANFCPNCTTTQVLTNSPDPVTLTYPTSLQYYNATTGVASGNYLTVSFQPHTGTGMGACERSAAVCHGHTDQFAGAAALLPPISAAEALTSS